MTHFASHKYRPEVQERKCRDLMDPSFQAHQAERKRTRASARIKTAWSRDWNIAGRPTDFISLRDYARLTDDERFERMLASRRR